MRVTISGARTERTPKRRITCKYSPLTCSHNYATNGYMLQDDIVEGIYLKQITERSGIPAGLIGVVHKVGTDWTGEWFFQFRYLNRPTRTRTKASSPWSLNLREEDLVHFEYLGPWLPAEVLLAASPPSFKPKKEPRLPVGMRTKGHPNQLRLFEDS